MHTSENRVTISSDKSHNPNGYGWDIIATVGGEAVKTSWAIDRQRAYNQARILADYYTDDNGQSLDVVWIDDPDKR